MLYLDNDTVITLAELDLLDLLCPALGEERHDGNVFCLRSCAGFVRSQVGEPARTRALDFLRDVGPTSGHLHGTELAELSRIERVDLEAELFACCANDEGSRVLTGDLKAVRAVADGASPATRAKLKGRVRTTEQCVLAILDDSGFAAVDARWSGNACDSLFFGGLPGMNEAQTRAKLQGRIEGFSPGMMALVAL